MLLNKKLFFYQEIQTPLGFMLAVADEKELYVLQFIDTIDLSSELNRLGGELAGYLMHDWSMPLQLVKQELQAYFAGTLKHFTTPIHLQGSDFQNKVWSELVKTDYGAVRSYESVAWSIKNDKAVRAVGSANGANKLTIIIPCHRVVQKGGKLGGYAAGTVRKKWLLEHEKKFMSV